MVHIKTMLAETVHDFKRLNCTCCPKITFLMSKESSVSLVFNKKRTNAFGVLWREL